MFVDASYNIHCDGKGQSGVVIYLFGNPIYWSSKKQKTQATSSSEAELLAVEENLKILISIKNIVDEIMKREIKCVLYQDNQSIQNILIGNFTSTKMKYIRPKIEFVKEQLRDQQISIEYCSTDSMTADIFTKPLVGKKFIEFRTSLCLR